MAFKPTVAQQRKCPSCSETAVDGELVVMYDVNREQKAGELQVGEDRPRGHGAVPWGLSTTRPPPPHPRLWARPAAKASAQAADKGPKRISLGVAKHFMSR